MPFDAPINAMAPAPAYERTIFQHDRDRIIHCRAFRRLQFKTQVFVTSEGDHFRTRLTHSLEVSQIARSLARALAVDEDLTEAIALAHDLGHPPFGHAGEAALGAVIAECLGIKLAAFDKTAMKVDRGLFDHNLQTFRILTELEQSYSGFDGLNLSRATLVGLSTHNGPMHQLPPLLRDYSRDFDLRLEQWPGLEAQLAAYADDIAYNNHDLDDGLRAGLIVREQLYTVPLISRVLLETEKQMPQLPPSRLMSVVMRRLIHLMVYDLYSETRRRLSQHKISEFASVIECSEPLVGFSTELKEQFKEIGNFLFKTLYRHEKLMEPLERYKTMLREIYLQFWNNPEQLPSEWQNRLMSMTENQLNQNPPPQMTDLQLLKKARVIADYIAGMTDRFAETEFKRLLPL